MGVYVLTVFEKDGSKALDESFEAATEKEAKAKGESLFTRKKDCMKKTHRCTSSAGKLVLFQR
ncbi:YhzD family protein [Bacillus pacificus]